MTPYPSSSTTSFKAARTIMALILREVSSTYGKSSAGYLWALLEPIGAIAFITTIFALALRSPSLGDSFPLFYSTGILPLLLFNEVSNKCARSIQYSRPLLAYPRVTYVDAIIARVLLNSMTSILVGVALLGGMIALNPSFVLVNVPAVALAYFMAVSLAVGIGTLNCFLFWKFPFWMSFWGILMRPLFLISAVLYIFEDLPRAGQDILWWNPICHITGQMRKAIFATYDPQYISYIFVAAVSIGTMSLGLMLLNRYHQDILFS